MNTFTWCLLAAAFCLLWVWAIRDDRRLAESREEWHRWREKTKRQKRLMESLRSDGEIEVVGTYPGPSNEQLVAAGVLRPDSDFAPRDSKRQHLLDVISLNINTMPDELVDRFIGVFNEHYNIKPLRGLGP